VVSGSGPTCAFLCAHADAARDLAEELDDARVCSSTRVATAPAPGARITA
jgi:4-diphosphocytidyl-2-C-methyl-D-erythritol kinase